MEESKYGLKVATAGSGFSEETAGERVGEDIVYWGIIID